MNRKHWIEVTVILFSLVSFKPASGSGSHEAAADQRSLQSSSVTVVGRVFCDTCFQRKFTRKSYFVAGAWVDVECSSVKKKGKTDGHGFFRIEFPSGFSTEKEIESCKLHLLGSSPSPVSSCNVPFIKTRSRLSIKSKMNNDYVYTAPPLAFRPPRPPPFCKRSMSGFNSSKFDIPFPFPPIPPISFPLPPLFPPFWGLPPLPFWPPLPDIPVPPPPPPPPPPAASPFRSPLPP